MSVPDLVVLWRVYEHCNLACAFCGYSRQIRRPRAIAEVGRILAFGRLLADYRRTHQRRVLVSWLGGEPLLWRELPGLSQIYRRRFDIRLSVTTSGRPLESPALRQHLIANYDEVTISVDGVGDVHDCYRQSPGLYDQLARIVASLRTEIDAAGSRMLLKVNTILMRGNIAAFESLCQAMADWGVQVLTFNQLGGNDRPEFYPANRLTPRQVEVFAQALPGVRQRMLRHGLMIRGSERYIDRIAHTARGESIGVDDCQPGSWFLFIDERGLVGPCSFTASRYGIPLEEIATAGGLERLPLLFAQRRQGAMPQQCADCHSTQVFAKFASPDAT